jgi:hypothetical protein
MKAEGYIYDPVLTETDKRFIKEHEINLIEDNEVHIKFYSTSCLNGWYLQYYNITKERSQDSHSINNILYATLPGRSLQQCPPIQLYFKRTV